MDRKHRKNWVILLSKRFYRRFNRSVNFTDRFELSQPIVLLEHQNNLTTFMPDNEFHPRYNFRFHTCHWNQEWVQIPFSHYKTAFRTRQKAEPYEKCGLSSPVIFFTILIRQITKGDFCPLTTTQQRQPRLSTVDVIHLSTANWLGCLCYLPR